MKGGLRGSNGTPLVGVRARGSSAGRERNIKVRRSRMKKQRQKSEQRWNNLLVQVLDVFFDVMDDMVNVGAKSDYYVTA